MFITLMSTLAQNEVESLSQNVKMGIWKKRRQLDLFLNCICRDMERIP